MCVLPDVCCGVHAVWQFSCSDICTNLCYMNEKLFRLIHCFNGERKGQSFNKKGIKEAKKDTYETNKISDLLGYYAESCGNPLPTLRNISE
jgi:hypothetical protein